MPNANFSGPLNNSQSFMSPSSLLAPDLSVQQQQVQRQQDLAAALRQMSFDPIDAGKGNIAWTQGAAKLAQALAGRIVQSRADKQQMNLNQAFAGRMGSMFGTAGGGGQASGGGGAPSPPPSISPPQSASPAPPMTPSVLQPPPMRPQVDPLAALPEQMPQQPPMPPQGAPMPQQAPQQMPDAPPPPPPDAQQAPQRGAWSMTGDPRKDMALYMSNPEEYTKALIANASKGAAPTDVEVMQSHIVEAAKAGDWGRVKALTEMMNKTTNLPPISLRQGVAIDPVTHEPVFQVGQAPVGSMVDYEGGKPVGQHVINGAPQTIATLAAAEAGGKAAGGAPYEMMQTYNPQTGQMEYHPKTAVMGAQGAPGAGGPVGSLYGQRGGGGAGIAAGAPLGTPEAAGAYGKFSGGAFGDIQQVAANSPQALQSLREMTQLVGDGKVSTGPNSAKLQEIGQHYGLDFLTRPGNFVFNKDAARYIAQSAQGLGLNGSDQRLGLLSSATPGQVMPTAALNQVLPVVQGLEMAKMAHADMAGQWAQAHPNDIGGFQTFWRRNYDPEMFTAMSKGTADFQKNYLNKKLSPMQRNVALGKMRALAGAGVNFSAFDQ